MPADKPQPDLTHEVLTAIEFRFDDATGAPQSLVSQVHYGIEVDAEFRRQRIINIAVDAATVAQALTAEEIAAIVSIRQKIKQYARTLL